MRQPSSVLSTMLASKLGQTDMNLERIRSADAALSFTVNHWVRPIVFRLEP